MYKFIAESLRYSSASNSAIAWHWTNYHAIKVKKKEQKSALDWIMNNIFHVDIVRSDFKLMRLLLSKQATYDMLFGICFQNSVLACVVQFMNYNLENVPKCVNMNENTSIISMNSHSSLSKCQKINN